MDHPDEKHRGTLSRGLFVMLRIGELLSGVIVLSLTGRFFFLLDVGLGSPNARLIYTSVIASMTVVLSLLFMPPLPYAFWSFPIDMFMFAAWLVAFCLLETVSCSPLFTWTDADSGQAHRDQHVQFGLVQELLGLLLGSVVHGRAGRDQRQLGGMQLLPDHPGV